MRWPARRTSPPVGRSRTRWPTRPSCSTCSPARSAGRTARSPTATRWAAAAIGGFPGLITTDGSVTPVHDLGAQSLGQAIDLAVLTLLAFAPRAELEARAGGNPSSNVGVDYGALVRGSSAFDDVTTRYRA